MRSGKACISTSPRRCASTVAGGAVASRTRRRHCFAAASIAARPERFASWGARPLRNAASARQRAASASPPMRSGSRASTSAARSHASARSSPSSADSSIAASRGCVPSASMRLPSGVMAFVSVSAPSRRSRSRAAFIAPGGGASTKRRSSLPHAANSNARAPSSTSAISGRRCGSSRCDCGHRRYAQPSATRPARPARWSAEACEMWVTSRREKPLFGSYEGSRASPLSTTTRTPGSVTDDSATLVASTTRRRPWGSGCRASDCFSTGSSPCRASTMKSSFPSPFGRRGPESPPRT